VNKAGSGSLFWEFVINSHDLSSGVIKKKKGNSIMVPNGFYETADDFLKEETPAFSNKTYDLDNMREFVDELKVVRQAVAKMLSTEKNRYPVYSENYGLETADLLSSGMSPDYICAELQRRICEVLLSDERITAVDDFGFDVSKNAVTVSFSVKTVFSAENITESREFLYV
jgi:hypothetical protein